MKYCVLTSFLIVIANVMAHPNGAPSSACNTMTPAHGFKPQTSFAPFIVTPLTNDVMKNTFIPIALASVTSNLFKGYLLMAFEPEGKEPIGKFSVHDNGRPISCGSTSNNTRLNNAVTHSMNDDKPMVTVIWKPPYNFVGQVQFRATFVKDVATYWVNVTSQVVNVVDSYYPSSSSTSISCTLLIFLATVIISLISNRFHKLDSLTC